jgi:hypothetical protein
VSHDTGVHDPEADVSGTRWALVEYAPGRASPTGATRPPLLSSR